MHDHVTQIYARPQLTAVQLATFADALGCVVNSCIDVLDIIAGDPELEPNGDEMDGSVCEDVPLFHDEHPMRAMSAGCEISDGDGEHDGREEESAQ